METTTAPVPAPRQVAETKRKRSNLLAQMRAQAKRDTAETISRLREQVERYRTLDPGSDEAEDIAFLFTDCLIVWANEARFEVPAGLPCSLSLDLDCEAAENYSIAEFDVVSASAIYSGGIYVHVQAIESELHDLLITVQQIVDGEEDRQLREAEEEVF